MKLTESEEVIVVSDVHDCDPQVARHPVARTAMGAPQTGDPAALVAQPGPGVILLSLYNEHPITEVYRELD
jgi:hypothetical protein